MKEEDELEEGKVMVIENEVQVSVEEKLEEVDFSNDPQKSKPILISSKLTNEEKMSMVQLLKEFKDVFAWE